MTKVYLHELKSRKRLLRKINCKPIISAGFADDQEKEFTITFDCENGEMVDLSIFFGSSKPKIYVSDEYS